MTQFRNLSLDDTLGGNSPSDYVIPSQKAIKEYVDTGLSDKQDSLTAGTGIDITNDTISVVAPTLINTATQPKSITILGTAATNNRTINIGYDSLGNWSDSVIIGGSAKPTGECAVAIGNIAEAYYYSTALGYGAKVKGQHSIAIGQSAIIDTDVDGAIQIGYGTNTESKSLNIGFWDSTTPVNYKLLGSNGIIPIERLGATSGDTSKFLKGDGTWVDITDGITLTDIAEAGSGITFTSGSSEVADYTVVGSPTIGSDYVATGFDSGYIQSPEALPSSLSSFDFIIKAYRTSYDPSCVISDANGGLNFIINDNTFCCRGDKNATGGSSLSQNTWYWYRLIYSSGTITGYVLQDNSYTIDTLPDISSWSYEFSFSDSSLGSKKLNLGHTEYTGYWLWRGSISLSDCLFKANGDVWWQPVQIQQGGKTTISSDIIGLPSQTGQSGKFLTTNGTSASWATVSGGSSYTPDLFDFKWTDYLLNDQNWLRADTYSWQDGAVYSNAYNHLVDDIDGKTATTETIGSYTISYYLADDGHKITTDEATVLSIYNESGVAWYYILDTTNTRFKLPRTKYGFTGLRDTVGKYVPESLPNITGSFNGSAKANSAPATGAFSWTNTYCGAGFANLQAQESVVNFNATNSSSTYQDNAPVQQRATQMYLYFYVGQFSQTATEQTAGLNAELFNGKVDLNLNNMNPSATAKETIVGWGIPDYNSGVSGLSFPYTANYKGFVYARIYCYETYAGVKVNGNNVNWVGGSGYNRDSIFIPVDVNDVISITGASSIEEAIFYPMKGVA